MASSAVHVVGLRGALTRAELDESVGVASKTAWYRLHSNWSGLPISCCPPTSSI